MSVSRYECAQRPGDAAAYALGALEPEEARAFARHAESCVVCRDELTEFMRVVDDLALSPRQLAPPRRLRRAVLAAAETEPRLASFSARHRRRWAAAGALAAGLATAAIVLVVGLGGPPSTSAPVSRSVRAQVLGSDASAQLRLASGRAELVVTHLPQPGPGKIYEVWLEPAGSAPPRPTGALFGVTTAGDAVVDVPGDLRRVAAVMVTREPAGGTSTPTSAPVIVARLD